LSIEKWNAKKKVCEIGAPKKKKNMISSLLEEEEHLNKVQEELHTPPPSPKSPIYESQSS